MPSSQSIFIYRHKNNGKPALVLSFAVLHLIYSLQEQLPNTSTESILYLAFRDAVNPSEFEFTALTFPYEEAGNLLAEAIKPDETGKEHGGSTSELLKSFSKYLSELDFDTTLMAMTGYDYQKAEYLYKYVPAISVRNMVKAWITGQIEQLKGVFECVVYGMGGELKPATPKIIKDPESYAEARMRGLNMASDSDMELLNEVRKNIKLKKQQEQDTLYD